MNEIMGLILDGIVITVGGFCIIFVIGLIGMFIEEKKHGTETNGSNGWEEPR